MLDGAIRPTRGAAEFAPGDHVCAVYRSAPERDAMVETYIRGARVAGHRTMFLDRDEAPALYGGRHVTDPRSLLADFERQAVMAVAEGYGAWAVVVDGTALVLTPESRASFARWEHLADRMFRSSGKIRALCVYDGREIGADAAAELGVLHQQTLPDDTPFHLCAGAEDVRLDGELDLATLSLLDSAFATVTSARDGDVVVDVSQLDFVDHRSLHVLGRHAEAHGKRVVLRSAKPIVRRLIEAAGVPAVTATTS